MQTFCKKGQKFYKHMQKCKVLQESVNVLWKKKSFGSKCNVFFREFECFVKKNKGFASEDNVSLGNAKVL